MCAFTQARGKTKCHLVTGMGKSMSPAAWHSVLHCSNPDLCCSLEIWHLSPVLQLPGSIDKEQTLLLLGLPLSCPSPQPSGKVPSLCLPACPRHPTSSSAMSTTHSYHSGGMAGALPWRTSWPAPVQSNTSFDDLQDKGPVISSSDDVKPSPSCSWEVTYLIQAFNTD